MNKFRYWQIMPMLMMSMHAHSALCENDKLKLQELTNNEITDIRNYLTSDCHHSFRGVPYDIPILPLHTRPDENIAVTKGLMNGQLTPFWAQELIGADLAQETMEQDFAQSPTTSVVLLDNNFATKDMNLNEKTYIQPGIKESYTGASGHGALVGNFINDKIVSAGANANITFVANFTKTSEQGIGSQGLKDKPEYLKEIIDDVIDHHSSKNLASPRLVNISSEIPYENFNDELSRLREKTNPPALTIGISHNSYPKPVNPQLLKEKENAIIVGSLAPSGLPSDFSQEDSEVFITAPSDTFITGQAKKNENGDPLWRTFGGTSSAAPLVTGAIANLTSILPDIDNKLIRDMVRITAIPTVNKNEVPRRNGHGTINAYGLIEAAKFLKEKCSNIQNKPQCYEKELQNFDNKEMEADLENLSALTYPSYSCVKKKSTNNSVLNCHQKEVIIKKIRKAALKKPQNKLGWELLACIYKQEGFLMNSHLYQSIADSIGGLSEFEIFKKQYLQSNDEIKKNLLNSIIKGQPKEKYVNFIIENSNEDVLTELAVSSSYWNDEKGLLINKVFKKLNKSENRHAFLQSIKTNSRRIENIESALRGLSSNIRKNDQKEISLLLDIASAGKDEAIKTVFRIVNENQDKNLRDQASITLLTIIASNKLIINQEFITYFQHECDFFSINSSLVNKLKQRNPEVEKLIPSQPCILR